MLTITRGIHQLLDEFFVIIRRGITDKGVDLGRIRDDPGQIERQTPGQRAAVGLRIRLQSGLREPGQPEGVDGVA